MLYNYFGWPKSHGVPDTRYCDCCCDNSCDRCCYARESNAVASDTRHKRVEFNMPRAAAAATAAFQDMWNLYLQLSWKCENLISSITDKKDNPGFFRLSLSCFIKICSQRIWNWNVAELHSTTTYNGSFLFFIVLLNIPITYIELYITNLLLGNSELPLCNDDQRVFIWFISCLQFHT